VLKRYKYGIHTWLDRTFGEAWYICVAVHPSAGSATDLMHPIHIVVQYISISNGVFILISYLFNGCISMCDVSNLYVSKDISVDNDMLRASIP
jgi:hypothetical protein